MPELRTLSADSVIDITKNVLGRFSCKWGSCESILNSWNTLQKHQHRHCCRSQDQDGKWNCKIAGCAGRIHNSIDALQSHVDLSHMSRLQVPCPIRDCEQQLMRPAQLPMHFESSHPELLGRAIMMHSNILKPNSDPLFAQVDPPPPLRFGSLPLHDADPLPVRKNWRKRKLSPTSSQVGGRKWSRLDAQDEEDSEEENFDLESFPRSDRRMMETHDFVIRRKPPEQAAALLSSAYRIVDPAPPDEDPPQTILFETFAEKVDDMAINGLI